MCKAFSALVTKSGKVYWKAGLDNHDDLVELFRKKDKELKDDKEPPKNTFARIEIVPHDGNYLDLKQRWNYYIDEGVKPDFLTKEHEKKSRQALKEWQQEVYSKINLEEALNPIDPFKIKHGDKVTQEELELLKKWASVWDSVRTSVGDSVGASVRDSVRASVGDSARDSLWASVRASLWDSLWDSVWDSVGDSLWDSVRASVWAYIGSLFTGIDRWKYVDYKRKDLFRKGVYPFQPAVDLWKRGLVASYDGKLWHLNTGKKAKVIWKGKSHD